MSEEAKFDKYVLERRLAVGGMAEVFLGHLDGPQGFQKKVVVKRILPDCVDDASRVKMFLDESRLAARFSHPNLIHVYQLVEEEGQYGLAMEYVEGPDLRTIRKKSAATQRAVPFDVAAFIIAEAADGLHYAHTLTQEDGSELAVVHRDVSPANILVSWLGVVKVVDFGVAKHSDRDEQTRAGVIKGKYAYMSPEQIVAGAVDARSDIFSLGAVFYELLTLRGCFHRKTMADTGVAIREGRYKPLQRYRPDLPEALDAILKKMLAVDTAERYRDAAEVSQDLRRFLATRSMPAARDVASFLEELFTSQEKTEVVKRFVVAGDDAVAVAEELAEPGRRLSRSAHDRLLANADGEASGDSDIADEDSGVTAPHGEALPAAPEPPGAEEDPLPDPAPDGKTQIAAMPRGLAWTWHSLPRNRQRAIAAAGAVLLLGAVVAVTIAASRGDGEGGAADATAAAAGATEPENMGAQPPTDRPAAEPEESTEEPGAEPAVEPADEPAVEPAAEPEDASEPRPKRRKVKNRGPPPGALNLSSEPRLTVYVDGKRVGTTPLRGHALSPGRHTIGLRNTELKISRSLQVEIEAGKTQSKKIELKRGAVAFKIKPWAVVYLNGQRIGTSPLDTLKLYEGTYRIKLVNPEIGGKPRQLEVTVKAGETEKVVVDLLAD